MTKIQIFAICSLVIIIIGCSPEPRYSGYTIRELKGGGWEDDSTYVYCLPFEKGEKYYLAQAYNSRFSHKDELSLDFKMKKGSKICAGRNGIVVATKEDSNIGGLKEKYLTEGNHIIILHDDGSYGGYWHLQQNGSFVEVGDEIERGQLIGESGHTGYSAFPHLHFWVYRFDGDQKITIPTRFETASGIRYLKPSRNYTRPMN